MEMGVIDMQAAQQRLEEKRAILASSRPTDPVPIGSVLPTVIDVRPCCNCGTPVNILSDSFAAEHRNFPVQCDVCKNRQKEEDEAMFRKEMEERERERIREAWARKLKNCEIGARFVDMTFDDYKPTTDKARAVLAACEEYVKGFDPKSGANLLMVGACGTGKNMLSAIIGQELMKAGYSFLHTTALKLVRKVKESWRRDAEETEQQAINLFTRPDLLAIDEIGVQFGSPTEQLFINEVINERYEARRPTILISNLTLKQLEEVIGYRAIDRFYEGESKMLVFDWQSYRRKR